MNDDFNVAERILCEDDACIGLVGPDGKCKVCGVEYRGPESLPLPGEGAAVIADGEDAVVFSSAGLQTESVDPDVDDRVLCPDDTCIGIIGADGACGTCGKTA